MRDRAHTLNRCMPKGQPSDNENEVSYICMGTPDLAWHTLCDGRPNSYNKSYPCSQFGPRVWIVTRGVIWGGLGAFTHPRGIKSLNMSQKFSEAKNEVTSYVQHIKCRFFPTWRRSVRPTSKYIKIDWPSGQAHKSVRGSRLQPEQINEWTRGPRTFWSLS